MLKEKQNIFLWVVALGTVVKSVFTEYGYDASYHVALSWRHINGDRLLGEMWEPHQTSSFVIDILMMIYRIFVPTMTGVALYLQITGAIIYTTIVWSLYCVLCKFCQKKTATIIAVLVLVARPKGSTLIEFSNLLVIASILLFNSLYYLYVKKKILYCVFAAMATCVLVLSYPTSIICFACIVFVLAKQDKKYVLCYIGVCVCIGMLYVMHVGITNGVDTFFETVFNIIGGDKTHRVKSVTSIFKIEWDFPYVINVFFPILIVMGYFGRKRLNALEKYMWELSCCISLSIFSAVLILTNLGILSACGYLVLGAAISIVPLSKYVKKYIRLMLVFICGIIILSRGLWIINGYSAVNNRFITNIENVIRDGPTKGIIAPLNIVNEAKESINDWRLGINEDDVVLAVGEWIIDSSVYLYTNAEIAHYSTINTTTYSEKLEEYWRLYPKKRPTVIAYKSYQGDTVPTKDTYIGRLIADEYEVENVGYQWTFYRIKQNN